jgi:surfeit locus 1 family protein
MADQAGTNQDGGFHWRGYIFRPALGPTMFTVLGVVFMVFLGSWQVQRLFWKQDLIITRQSRFTAPLVTPLLANADSATVGEFEFYRVRLEGMFLHDHEMFLGARSLMGHLGYHVITPLRCADGSLVLIDRGWVPLDYKDPASRAATQIEGPVSLEGVIRADGRKSRFTPDNVPEENFWFYVDLPAMASYAGQDPFASWYVEASATPNPGGFPVGGQSKLDLPNDHLQYALSLYSLALALFVIYLIYSNKGAENGADIA